MPSESTTVTGPEALLWLTRRAASASVRRGVAFAPELVSAPMAGLTQISLGAAGCAERWPRRRMPAAAAAWKVAFTACRLFIMLGIPPVIPLDEGGRPSVKAAAEARGKPVGRAAQSGFGNWIAVQVERGGQTAREVNRRGPRMAGAMHLERPARLIDLPDQIARLLKRRRLSCEIAAILTYLAGPQRSRHLPVARARGSIRSQAAITAGETQDGFTRMLKTLPEQARTHIEDLGCFRSRHFQDFAEHVGEPVRPVQALQHPQCTGHLDLFDQQGMFGFRGRFHLESTCEVFRKAFEAQVQPFDRALPDVQDVVHRDPVSPSLQLAPKVELRQAGDDADQDL